MSKSKYDMWKEQTAYEGDSGIYGGESDVLEDAHDALHRFYQKEKRRDNTVKKRKQCWQ